MTKICLDCPFLKKSRAERFSYEEMEQILSDLEQGRYHPCRGYWYGSDLEANENPLCRGSLTFLYKEAFYRYDNVDRFMRLEVVKLALRNNLWKVPEYKEEDSVYLCREEVAMLELDCAEAG